MKDRIYKQAKYLLEKEAKLKREYFPYYKNVVQPVSGLHLDRLAGFESTGATVQWVTPLPTRKRRFMPPKAPGFDRVSIIYRHNLPAQTKKLMLLHELGHAQRYIDKPFYHRMSISRNKPFFRYTGLGNLGKLVEEYAVQRDAIKAAKIKPMKLLDKPFWQSISHTKSGNEIVNLLSHIKSTNKTRRDLFKSILKKIRF